MRHYNSQNMECKYIIKYWIIKKMNMIEYLEHDLYENSLDEIIGINPSKSTI